MPMLLVGGMQKIVAPVGNCGSGAPDTSMVGRKHERVEVKVHDPHGAGPQSVSTQL